MMIHEQLKQAERDGWWAGFRDGLWFAVFLVAAAFLVYFLVSAAVGLFSL